MLEDTKVKKDPTSISFDEIYQTTWHLVYRFVYYNVRNHEDAEDITQEAYIKAFNYLEKEEVNHDKYLGFIKTIALNTLRDLWRKKKRQGRTVDIEAIYQKEVSLKDSTLNSMDRMFIEEALTHLRDEYRKVIELRYLTGYSVAETAKIMGKKVNTTRVIQYRALQQLLDINASIKEEVAYGI